MSAQSKAPAARPAEAPRNTRTTCLNFKQPVPGLQVSPLEKLLPRLQRVKRTGPNTFIASAPTRDDRHPSLAVKELDDGRILVHDFGGDSVDEILAAVGLTLADLFVRRDRAPGAGSARQRRPWSAMDLLALASFEASVIVLITGDMLAGREADRARLIEAAARLQNMVEAVNAH